MYPVLDTFSIYKDEDTGVIHIHRLAIPYNLICGPIQDATYLWTDHECVTAFQDEFGERYHVLEPFAKVLDNWLLALEKESHKPISFSSH